MTRYAEVIVPLPIQSTFTYSVPDDMTDIIEEGSRVFVPFGRKKYYTGIVSSIHTRKPMGYEVKPLMMVLDPKPVVRYPQIRFWKWIADYYLCSIGDVYRAAVPSGLKLESETLVTAAADYEPDNNESPLSAREQLIIGVATGSRVKISEIEKNTGLRNIGSTINSLLERGALLIDEKIIDRYRPKKETFVTLAADRNDGERLHEIFGLITRSQRQERALLAWMDLAGWGSNEELRPVTRRELLERAGITPHIIKALADKGIFKIEKREVNRFALPISNQRITLPELSPVQQKALIGISEQWRDKSVTLLHGITGSGKTEIYSRLIFKALESGNSVLYLVPEISLTTQLTDRLRRIFGDRLVVYHSKFSDNERVDLYRRILRTHEPLVVLGARSAVFLPFNRLGLVVVDEEHESSFKQFDPAPRYNARDAAIMLASLHGAKTLLGSATPSIETYYKAVSGKFGLVELSERYEGAELPDIEIVDMREQRKRHLAEGVISAPLRDEVHRALKEGKQAIMFQNRRGYAPMVQCRACGWTPKCIYCDVSMVFHKGAGMLRCHYCGHAVPKPALCPACGSDSIEVYGHGTERIADEMHEAFPEARVARMDLDTTRGRDAHQEIIDEFSSHDTDILVGTQMVCKGLDFSGVSLVAALNADTLLNFPDFRSDERAFNMLTQAAGRAGRRQTKGDVLIQTTDPSNPVLAFVKKSNYKGFYDYEIESRRKFSYPPFTKVVNVCIKHRDPKGVREASQCYAGELRRVFGNRVLGPHKPLIGRVATWYIENIMLKIEPGASMAKVRDILRQIQGRLAGTEVMKGAVIFYDVDPA